MKTNVTLVEADWRKIQMHTLSLAKLSQKINLLIRASVEDCILHVNRDKPSIIINSESESLTTICNGIRTIKRHHPSIKFVVLLNTIEAINIQKLLHFGVEAIESANIEAEYLVDVIEKLDAGKHAFNQLCIDQMLTLIRKINRSPLTKREEDVLLQLSYGKTYQQICDSLNFTRGSLSIHIQNLYKKLGVTCKSDALIVATERNYISRTFLSL
jgi:DNA-binding NarL/FixJ family response regulator